MQAIGFASTHTIMFPKSIKSSSSRYNIDGEYRNTAIKCLRKTVVNRTDWTSGQSFVGELFSGKRNLSRNCVFITANNNDSKFHSKGGRSVRSGDLRRRQSTASGRIIPRGAVRLSRNLYERNSSG